MKLAKMKAAEDCDRRAKEALADLLPLVQDPAVATDDEFVNSLECALKRAQDKAKEEREKQKKNGS